MAQRGQLVPAGLEHHHVALQIAAHVVERRLQRMAHAGLRGEVDHAVDALVVAARKRGDRREVGDVGLGEGEAGMRLQPLQARPLQPRVVVAVEAVDPEHLLVAGEQGLCDVIADEAGAAGDQDRHAGRPSVGSRVGSSTDRRAADSSWPTVTSSFRVENLAQIDPRVAILEAPRGLLVAERPVKARARRT